MMLLLDRVEWEVKRLLSTMLKLFASSAGSLELKIQRSSCRSFRTEKWTLARAKDVDEGIKEFRRFKEESNKPSRPKELKTKKTRTAFDGNGKYLVAHSEDEMILKLHEGYRLVQSLNHDKYLMEVVQ